jgi:hypothetical protein
LQAQLLIIGRITALEKVGSFILEKAARLSQGRGNSVALPVSRYDIADYLAVSVETVSRSLTDLRHRGVIEFSGTAPSGSSTAPLSRKVNAAAITVIPRTHPVGLNWDAHACSVAR